VADAGHPHFVAAGREVAGAGVGATVSDEWSSLYHDLPVLVDDADLDRVADLRIEGYANGQAFAGNDVVGDRDLDRDGPAGAVAHWQLGDGLG